MAPDQQTPVALPDRFYLAGRAAIPVDIPDWSKPKEGRPRIFQSDLLERLTVVHPALPPSLFLPIIFYLLYSGAWAGLSIARTGALFFAGLFFWTLAEYVLHRFVFHFVPGSRQQVVLAYFLHGIHHAYPADDRRLVLPPVLSLTLAVPFYLSFKTALGVCYPPALAGFFAGYLCYDMTHYLIHARPLRSRLGSYLRRRHLFHHFAAPDRCYGVSSPLWDYFFGT